MRKKTLSLHLFVLHFPKKLFYSSRSYWTVIFGQCKSLLYIHAREGGDPHEPFFQTPPKSQKVSLNTEMIQKNDGLFLSQFS